MPHYSGPQELVVYPDPPPAQPVNKFWLVWNPQGHSPHYRHLTEESARTEAARLARCSPTDHFYVLEAKSRFEAAPPITTIELLDSEPAAEDPAQP